MQIVTTNNKEFQIRIIKNALSNIIAIKILDKDKFFGLIIFIKYSYGSKSKHINKYRNNNKFISSITSIECLYSCKSKYISKNNKNSNLKVK